MIPASRHLAQRPAWQRELAEAVTDPCELLAPARARARSWLEPAAGRRGPRFPAARAARLRRPHAPRRPARPAAAPGAAAGRRNCDASPGYVADPRAASLQPRAAPGPAAEVPRPRAADHHRRLRRALPLLLPPPLPLRRADTPIRGRWPRRSQPIAADPSIDEVILSGGDPLSLGDARLPQLLRALARHPAPAPRCASTRACRSCCPRASTPACSPALARCRCRLVVVVHANHANEIDADGRAAPCGAARHRRDAAQPVGAAARRQRRRRTPRRSSASALFAAGVLPYYLHLLDPVAGAAHFDVPDDARRAPACADAGTRPAGLPGAAAGARESRGAAPRPCCHAASR